MIRRAVTDQDRNDPSPIEIERRAEEVRQKWSEKQRKSRAMWRELPWIPPIVSPIDFPSETTERDA
jgi:hypothetical protein